MKHSMCIFLGRAHRSVHLQCQDFCRPGDEKSSGDPSWSERTGTGEVPALGGGEGCSTWLSLTETATTSVKSYRLAQN